MRNLIIFTKLFFLVLLLCFAIVDTTAQGKKISMQGFLKDANGKAVADGNKVLAFKIYNATSGGTLLWTKTFSQVNVVGGVYAVQLGASDSNIEISTLAWDVPYYVGITVESEPELAPRTEFTYAPYTFAVNKANLADLATYATTAGAIGGALDLATGGFAADMRIIRNSKPITATNPDKNIHLGDGSGTTSSLKLFSNNVETMTIAGGNVGIGVTAPTAELDVARGAATQGTALFRGTTYNSNFNYTTNEDTYISGGKTGSKVYINQGHNGNVSIAAGGGEVGVGTTTPNATLDVVRGLAYEGTARFRGTAHHSHFNFSEEEDTYIRGGKAGSDVFINDVNTGNVNIATGGGRVGIGTSSPDYPLDIYSSVDYEVSSQSRTYFAYNATNGAGTTTNTSNSGQIKVRANGWYYSEGGGFVATSDKRIKNIIGISKSEKDLNILNKIEITDYKYKDEVSLGAGLQKKVIAQQVQEIYPIAINTQKGIIPNVFAIAKEVKVNGQATIISTTQAHDFKTGDLVKLILEKTGEKQLKVEVINATTFSVAEAIDDKIFVYGKHIDDLLTVDYDALAMLNVSATQELSKQIELLKAENAKLKSENKSYESRLTKIEALLQTGQNVSIGK